MNPTDITWCDFTWNPTTGCTFGCAWCYARGIARRFSCRKFPEYDVVAGGAAQAQPGEAFPQGFTPTVYPHRLDEPLRRKKPSVIFLGSMGDIFDPAIPDEFRDRIFATVAAAHWHTFVVLTKRVEEMRRYFTTCDMRGESIIRQMVVPRGHIKTLPEWPLPNLWLGVSVTNQADADERIPLLLDTPAARRMVSVEPMLGEVNFSRSFGGSVFFYIDFVAVGGKTPGKPLHEQCACEGFHEDDDTGAAVCGGRMKCIATASYTDGVDGVACLHAPLSWLRSLRDQCFAAGVPFHYKHGGTCPPLDGIIYDARPWEEAE